MKLIKCHFHCLAAMHIVMIGTYLSLLILYSNYF